jgi:hypothetical protein
MISDQMGSGETFWGDVLWLWGDGWFQHGLFIFGVLVVIGAIMNGWIEADNTLRINRRLRRDEERGA